MQHATLTVRWEAHAGCGVLALAAGLILARMMGKLKALLRAFFMQHVA